MSFLELTSPRPADSSRVFDWAQLPTELKYHVLQYCISWAEPKEHSSPRRKGRPTYQPKPPGVDEIVKILTGWAGLLHVSHQVRAITLRLCFLGGRQGTTNLGFWIFPTACWRLSEIVTRLGSYYQMIEADGLPYDERTQALADSYSSHPRLYPGLKQYATFRDAITTVILYMDFGSYMKFFQIQGFRHLKPDATYHIFELLPSLSDITLYLPGRPRSGWKDRSDGPRVFHEEDPCIRLLHRLIYEEMAAKLASYSVRVLDFLDDGEKDRFEQLQVAAPDRLVLKEGDLEELYADCGGGVQLDAPVQPGNWVTAEQERDETDQGDEDDDAFIPPECVCVERCNLAFDRVPVRDFWKAYQG